MISVSDIWDELVRTDWLTRQRVFGEPERHYRRGYRSGVMVAYCTLTGKPADEVQEDLNARHQAQHEVTIAQDPFGG